MADRGGPPDYVGVGVAGTPTRWWHDLLLLHPAIRGPAGRRRELGFFTEFCRREMRDRDVARYHRRFRRGPDEIAGEWTPDYIHEPWTPVLLRRAAPDAKLLVLLRDPFAQYRERLALARRARGEAEVHHLVVDAVGRLRHATQLRTLREVVPAERILVLQLEQCLRDPAGEYRRTLRFLGVDDSEIPERIRDAPPPSRRWRDRLRRRGPVEPAELWPDIEATLRDEIGPEVEDLGAMVPELRLELWPGFARGG